MKAILFLLVCLAMVMVMSQNPCLEEMEVCNLDQDCCEDLVCRRFEEFTKVCFRKVDKGALEIAEDEIVL